MKRATKATLPVLRTIRRLYTQGYGVSFIADQIGQAAPSTVWRWLKAEGVPLRPWWVKGLYCVDCQRPTQGAKRCPLHLRIRNAELNADYEERSQRKRR